TQRRGRRPAAASPSSLHHQGATMVFAVQCPNPKCRKYQLVEDHDRNKIVSCLLCKTPIRVGSGPPPSGRPTPSPTPPPRR
ncbi:MAG: hypothetical protein NZ700_05790, partial [Gemmataceae bacterium]|nr:hypothetical protein [Gemmataceae bacterium]MDW8265067.1 hypothetical protein [Gemmataceae bacterium]